LMVRAAVAAGAAAGWRFDSNFPLLSTDAT